MIISSRYFFSWRDPALQGVEEDWLGARNFCRKRCMDSVSLETSNENEWVKQRIIDGKVRRKRTNKNLLRETSRSHNLTLNFRECNWIERNF